MLNAKVASAMNSWLTLLPRLKRRNALGGKMSNAVRRMIYRHLSRGLVGWVATWEEGKRKKAALRRGLSYMMNRGLARGWGGWRLMIDERAAALALLSRGLALQRRGSLEAFQATGGGTA